MVVGGLKGADATPPTVHGHVVIVVSGPLAYSKYPTGYRGMLNSVEKKNTTINYIWNKDSRDDAIYASMDS